MRPQRNSGGLYRNAWCDMLGTCQLDPRVLHFWYKLTDILEECNMLTATIGAHRANDSAPHLLDLINLTPDERAQFYSLCRTAMNNIFVVLIKFTKNIKIAYRWDEGHPTKDIEKGVAGIVLKKGWWISYDGNYYFVIDDMVTTGNEEEDTAHWELQGEDFRHSVHYLLQFHPQLNPNIIEPLDIAIFDALKYFVMAEWLRMAYPSESEQYRQLFIETIALIKRYLNQLIGVIVNRIPRVF